jgi:lipopolysaccharide export system permease protein
MYHYNRYILKHLVHSTLLITFSLTSIVWLTQALRFIDFIVNQGVSITVFVTLTVLLIPSLLFMILPPALLVAILFVYNKLKVESELIVMQAAGLSKWRLAIPSIQMGVIVALFAYFIAFYLQPVSYRQFKDMQVFLRNNYVSILLQDGVFNNPVDGLTVFIRERDSNNILHGILVHDSRNPASSVTMMAEQGKLVETPQGPRFLLMNGNRQETRQGKLSFLNFENYTLDISLYTRGVGARYTDPQEMTVGQLFEEDSAVSPAENLRRHAEGHQRLLWPMYALSLSLVAMAILLSGEFNRRGHWQRVAIASLVSAGMLFSAVGLRGVMSANATLIPIAYLNMLLPGLFAFYILLDRLPRKPRMVSQA